MEEKEYSNIYVIPANYTDSGKLLGGMLEVRNTVEAGVLMLLIGYPELMWMSVSPALKVMIMTVTLMPAGILTLMGIGGDSLFQYLTHMAFFWAQRRNLHFRRIGHRYEKKKKTFIREKKKGQKHQLHARNHSGKRYKKRHH